MILVNINVIVNVWKSCLDTPEYITKRDLEGQKHELLRDMTFVFMKAARTVRRCCSALLHFMPSGLLFLDLAPRS